MAEPYYGEIKITTYNYAPRNWALCNGQLLPIAQNKELAGLLGATYGGDGVTTFGLPNLMGAAPMHISKDGTYKQGVSGGEARHILQQDESPPHTHGNIYANNADGDNTDPTNNWLAVPGDGVGNIYHNQPDSAKNVQMYGPTIHFVGGDPHNNMQPYLALNFIIALKGVFPRPN